MNLDFLWSWDGIAYIHAAIVIAFVPYMIYKIRKVDKEARA